MPGTASAAFGEDAISLRAQEAEATWGRGHKERVPRDVQGQGQHEVGAAGPFRSCKIPSMTRKRHRDDAV